MLSRLITQILEHWLVLVCFAIIYIVWGSTYLFSSYALQQIPAFELCGYRYLIAGILLGLITVLFYKPVMPSRLELRNACIAGFVFLGLGTGGAIWSLNYLDTGLTALIISGEPLIILLMLWVVNKKRPPRQAFWGIALAIVGAILLVSQDTLVSGSDQWTGVIVILTSMLAWGMGSIFVSKVQLPASQGLNSSIQMLVGGVSTMVISLIIREQGASFAVYTAWTWGSLAFLVIFGSVMAFTAFNYLLRTVSTEKVVTNTYVNPVIAMFLGWSFNNEPLTQLSILAALFMLSGVFLINLSKGTKKASA